MIVFLINIKKYYLGIHWGSGQIYQNYYVGTVICVVHADHSKRNIYFLTFLTTPTGMPHGPHLGPKWAAKWVPLGQPKWDPLRFVRGAHMGPKWVCPCVIQVGPNWDPRTIFQLEPTSLPSGSHVSN